MSWPATTRSRAPIVGTSGLNKTGTGKITLSAANGYSGPTVVSGGTLALSSAAGLGATDSITVAAGATLDVGVLPNYTLPSGRVLDGPRPHRRAAAHAGGA